MSHHTDFSLLTASLTPLDRNLNLNCKHLKTHVQGLLKTGASGVVLFGTTGEGNSLSVSERKYGLEFIVQGGISPKNLIVGTGCCALTDTVDLTKHALNVGVDRILVLPPFYYKNVSEDGLFGVFDHLLQQIGNRQIQVYIYHFPQMSGIPISAHLVERLLLSHGDNICGFKDSGGDWENISEMIQEFPQLQVFAGSEEFLLNTLQVGGAGCISATTNVTLPLAVKLISKWKTAEAKKLQQQLYEIRRSIERWPIIAALKALMQHMTGNDQWANLRPPLTPLLTHDAQSCIHSFELASRRTMMNSPIVSAK